jgi:hypothetical protein
MAEVDPARGTETYDPDAMVAQHVIDRHGLVWRLVRDGGMATRADDTGIISIGISTLTHQHGPLVNLSEFQEPVVKREAGEHG